MNVLLLLVIDNSGRNELSQTPKISIDEAAKYYGKREGLQQGETNKMKEILFTGIKNEIPLETLSLLTGLFVRQIHKLIARENNDH